MSRFPSFGQLSRSYSSAVADAKFWGRLQEETEFRRSDGAPFSVFSTAEQAPVDRVGDMPVDRARALLASFSTASSTVLELAATVHWLAFEEKVPDWRAEIEIRKKGKTSGGRLDKAIALLREIGLAPVRG